MLKWLKLCEHKHSGKIRPHEHTSYLSLVIVLLIVGISLSAFTVYAATPYAGPESGSIGLTGIMPAEAPIVAATITSPTNLEHFSKTPVTINGTCPDSSLVELFKNDIFAGSAACTVADTYSLDVDLLIGENTLMAKVFDALNQEGPDSSAITVYYDALPAQTSALSLQNFSNAQLLLNTNAVFRGTFPDKEMNVPIDILGGTPPFAVNIQWGDSTNKVVSRNDNISFDAAHTYTRAGTYQISIQASDSSGNIAFLTVASIVNGQSGAVTTSTTTSESIQNKLLVLWPLYVSAVAVVVSFFIGERREKRLLSSRELLFPTKKTI